MDKVNVIVEIPRDSRNKYEYDHENHTIKLDRHLIVSMGYPASTDSSPTPSVVMEIPRCARLDRIPDVPRLSDRNEDPRHVQHDR